MPDLGKLQARQGRRTYFCTCQCRRIRSCGELWTRVIMEVVTLGGHSRCEPVPEFDPVPFSWLPCVFRQRNIVTVLIVKSWFFIQSVVSSEADLGNACEMVWPSARSSSQPRHESGSQRVLGPQRVAPVCIGSSRLSSVATVAGGAHMQNATGQEHGESNTRYSSSSSDQGLLSHTLSLAQMMTQ